MMVYKRGDIVVVNLNPKKGHEVGKIRPAVVLSGEDENENLDTLIVAPLSSDLIDDMQPYRMRLKKRGALHKDSDVLLNHIRTVSKRRVGEKIAHLTLQEYATLKRLLCENF